LGKEKRREGVVVSTYKLESCAEGEKGKKKPYRSDHPFGKNRGVVHRMPMALNKKGKRGKIAIPIPDHIA